MDAVIFRCMILGIILLYLGKVYRLSTCIIPVIKDKEEEWPCNNIIHILLFSFNLTMQGAFSRLSIFQEKGKQDSCKFFVLKNLNKANLILFQLKNMYIRKWVVFWKEGWEALRPFHIPEDWVNLIMGGLILFPCSVHFLHGFSIKGKGATFSFEHICSWSSLWLLGW